MKTFTKLTFSLTAACAGSLSVVSQAFGDVPPADTETRFSPDEGSAKYCWTFVSAQ